MGTPSYDPGFTQKYSAPLKRVLNPDGSFNVRRLGSGWRDVHPYLWLISLRWPPFLALVVFGYLVTNTLFAGLYFWLGPGVLQGATGQTGFGRFLDGFFFSAHTLTTVGYGNLSPKGTPANIVASSEAMLGVMGFAVATGLLYGRFSRPSARLGFSEHALIAPFQNGQSLQMRVVNRRRNAVIELEARVLLMTVEGPPGDQRRKYQSLDLERRQVLFLPLTWTIVHPIVPSSPLAGKTPEELKQLQAEVLVLVKAYDETFGQTVHTRYSYRYDDFVWGARFKPAFSVGAAGEMLLVADRVGEHERIPAAEETRAKTA